MSLRRGPRPSTPIERWSIRLGVGLATFAFVFIGWAMTDVDGDGLASIQEMQYGTNPLNGDSDGDGASDGWEIRQSGGDRHAAEDGILPCGILADCPAAEPGAQPEPPSVSPRTATGLTVGIALLGTTAGIVAGLWAGRRFA